MAENGSPTVGKGSVVSQKKEIKVRVPENLQAGTFANNTMISHSREEFIIDFLMVAPPGGHVVSRVVVTPSHMKRMIATMQDNLQKYERNNGPVILAEVPPVNMGFSG